ncbi:beta-galactosidase family protein [Microbacterium sp. NPDC057650]|uniref:glycoside hydrolase family 35 protein n=1 Tax=unclassified Microbacterium TaxID=2609290 RepID=UPI00366E5834
MSAAGSRWIDGRQVLSGAVHYFRVHPEQWADRLARLAALGLNTVETYVAWNFHEPRRGERDFTGWRDLPRFIELAGSAGLDVIVRPGPYICAEWEGGGLPAWLGFDGPVALRTADPAFLTPVREFFADLLPRIAPLQATHGGPVIAVQVENEYGSFADDAEYLRAIRDALLDGGIDVPLFTSDGPTDLMVDGGTLPGITPTLNFGSRPADAMRFLEERLPGTPFFCGEYWAGWFDHWGEEHHRRPGVSAAGPVAEILQAGGSVNIYMAHGGTNFGLWSGANHFDGQHQPTVTSYDSDAAVAEDGRLTEKFRALREVFVAASGAQPPAPPADPVFLAPRRLAVEHGAGLLPVLDALAEPGPEAPLPLSMEQLRQNGGLTRYIATPILPRGEVELRITGLADRATVFLDGQRLGILSRNAPAESLTVSGTGERRRLDIVVESQGRVNYGPLLGEGKGILGDVLLQGAGVRKVTGWQHASAELDRMPEFAGVADSDVAGIARAVVELDAPADAHLALPGWGKGFVWLNGFLLGRHWEIGPQLTLYAPAPLWRAGRNEIVVLEMEHRGDVIEIRDLPQLGTVTDYEEWKA